jgi:uncharacterized sulfatase
MYTDESLRNFFREYARQPEFQHTIFILTGDHALPELIPLRPSPPASFNVPFVIWSPMLKAPQQFASVSSHFDVAPTLLALLSQCSHPPDACPFAAWMGSGIDTARDFRNLHQLAFTLKNK